MQIVHDDPRWVLAPDLVLVATAWYRSLPQPTRARLGLHTTVSAMKVGLQFENVLSRGLLDFALRLPDQDPQFRYVYHEIIEESQHQLMFHEFIRRSGLETPGLSAELLGKSRIVLRAASQFPELFFIFVLGGEDPIDHVQRTSIAKGRVRHPLIARISQIHITEEARHLCFARQYLARNVPRLSPLRRAALAGAAPLVLGVMAQLMMQPSRYLIETYQIPPAVIRDAYTKNPVHHQNTRDALAKVRALCEELDLLGPRARWIWRRFGLIEARA
jgi:hypothetical protein